MSTTTNSQRLSRFVRFGYNDLGFDTGTREFVEWVEAFATNAHMLIAGKSGTGKTFTIKRIIRQMCAPLAGREPVRVHVFDVHGDIQLEGESRVLFSQSMPYGISAFPFSSDPHFGGPRKTISAFIDTLNESSPKSALGPRQTSVLRRLLLELFELRGFKADDPYTWDLPEAQQEEARPDGKIYLDIPFDEKDLAKDIAKRESITLAFDKDRRQWFCSSHEGGLLRWPRKQSGKTVPTLGDVIRYANMKNMLMLTGGGSTAVKRLQEHIKNYQTFNAKLKKLQGGAPGQDIEALKEDIEKGKGDVIESFTDFVLSIESGNELEMITRYDSSDILKSIIDRLETLQATGIFKSIAPPFEPSSPIWVSDLKPLREAEKQFFVWTRLQQIFDNAMARGLVEGAAEVREVIIIDEAHLFFRDKEGNILDTLAKEARKFGIAMICASQAPSHFSEDFLSNVGTKILLGLDPMFHDQTVRKMRIDGKILDYIVAGKIAAIQVADKRNNRHDFRKTRVAN